MGALPSETDSHRDAVASALILKQQGNPLPFFRLQHALTHKDPPAIAAVLIGLTHFSAVLHCDAARARDIRLLTDAALAVDLGVLADSADDSPALEAHHLFIVNLVSANSAYVEPVLDMLATRAFPLATAARGAVVRYAYAAVAAVLEAYPRAAAGLVAVLRGRYPHPVRPAAEHCAYARSVLHVARECRNAAVGQSIVGMVFEKLGGIEALVPEEIFDVPATSPGKGEGVASGARGLVLRREAEKLESVLLELFRHVDILSKVGGAASIRFHFEAMFSAYESSIVPIEGTRFSPYVILYAASKGGEAVVYDLVERLRHAFFNSSVSERLREKYLQHSSAIVIRSSIVSPGAALKWISSIAKWLNRYIDARERRRSMGTVDVDTDVHRLFYTACCALMTTVSGRPDAFASRAAGGIDALDRMRIYRVVSCGMNPLLVSPVQIVRRFADFVHNASGMDLADIIEDNQGRYTPSRTKYGSRNEFSYTIRASELELPAARAKLEGYIRCAEGEEVEEDDDEMADSAHSIGGGISVGVSAKDVLQGMIAPSM